MKTIENSKNDAQIETFKELSPKEISELSPKEIANYMRELQTWLDKVEAEAKKYGKGNYKRTLTKDDFILLQILNAGFDGVNCSNLLKAGKQYTDRNGKISGVNVKTIQKNWNKRKTALQRGVLYLNNAQQFDPTSKRENVNCVILAKHKEAHPNSEMAKHKYTNDNVLTFISGQNDVKEYLLQRGATKEMFKQ